MLFALHFVFAIAGWLLALAAFPLFAELLVLPSAALLPSRRALLADPSGLGLAVVIPAHNEELLIAGCVESLATSSAPSVRIFVVAHNCSDSTAQRANAAGAQVLVLNDSVGGKGVALDHAFQHVLAAGADAVLVIDADSTVSPNLITVVQARLAAGADALQCRYQVANADATPRTRLAALAFLGMNVLRPRGRDRLGLSCGIFGNGFALAASTLTLALSTAHSLDEDLEYHLNLIAAGLHVEFVDQATVFGEMPESTAAATTQRARWEGGRILMRRQWTMPLLREVALGHFRLLEPLLDLTAVPLATEAALLAAIVLCGWLAASAPLVTYGLTGIAALLFYVIVSALLGPSPTRTLAALAAAPGYLFWKLLMIPRTRLAARRDATWIRTKRN